MTATTTAEAGPLPVARSGAVVAGFTARRALRSAVLWGYVFGLYVASSALGYAATYPTLADRERLALAFGQNAGLDALIGSGRDLQTVAGFTAWRSLGVLTVVGAVWGLLTSTRLLRGEEEAGRAELFAAGRTTRAGMTAQALAGLGAGLLVLFVLSAAVSVVVGRDHKVAFGTGAAVFLALALVAGAAVFLAVGALTSQLAPTRRQAASYAAAALGVSFVLRMIADSGTGLTWLRWVTPLGWVEELRPLTDPRPLALLPLSLLVVVLGALAVLLARRRDLGASTIPDRPTAPARTRLLGGPTALTMRLVRPTVVGWSVGVALLSLLLGYIAKSAGRALPQSPGVRHVLARLGAGVGGAEAYLVVGFLLVAFVVALVAAGQVAAARGEEAAGRLDNLVVRPVSRARWYGGRLGVAAAALLGLGVLGGLFAWFGAASQGTDIGAGRMLEGGLAAVPPAVLVLGLGALTFGVAPRATAAVAYGVVAWSLLVELVGASIRANHWVLDTSVFHHLASVPAVAPDWTSSAVLVGLGAAAAVVGQVALARRDLAGA